jgi:hypothetical protein
VGYRFAAERVGGDPAPTDSADSTIPAAPAESTLPTAPAGSPARDPAYA